MSRDRHQLERRAAEAREEDAPERAALDWACGDCGLEMTADTAARACSTGCPMCGSFAIGELS